MVFLLRMLLSPASTNNPVVPELPRTVAIRPLAESDGPAFVSAARASRSLHRRWVRAPLDATAFERHLSTFDSKTSFAFVAHLRSSGQLVGAINLTNVVYGPLRSGYLGYYAFSDGARRGYMTQALAAAVRHAFRELKLHRLEANIQPGNLASIALVRACGFRQEGYSPAYLKIAGRWRDHERWAIVRA